MPIKIPKLVLPVIGAVTYVGATYGTYKYFNSKEIEPDPLDIDGKPIDLRNFTLQDAQRLNSFHSHSKSYDSEIGTDEFFMGVLLLRRWHLRNAKGRVLEIGCGTGRNFNYYTSNATKVVAVDAVESMVEESKKKIKLRDRDRISVVQMDAHRLLFPDKSFNTVVDTFGLCSYNDPIAVLQEVSRVCHPNGRILLIEHGRGWYDWINNLLDKGACRHALNWGCIWNRDILAMLDSADIDVVSVSRYHFGTTLLIEAKPKKVIVFLF